MKVCAVLLCCAVGAPARPGDSAPVPLEEFARSTGAILRVDAATGRVMLKRGASECVLAAGIRTVLVDGQPRTFANAPRIASGRWEIPAEVADALRSHWRSPGVPGPQPVTADSPPVSSAAPLAGLRIVVDPGHGGRFTGAVGAAGTIEKDVNLDIARMLAERLAAAGADVRLTRSADRHLHDDWAEDLRLRSEAARAFGADLFLSVHANSAQRTDVRGFEVYVARTDPDAKRSAASRRLAQHVREELGRIGIPDRGVREADYRVLVHAPCPAVLVETEFLTNRDGESALASAAFRARVAQALAEAVKRFAGSR